MVESSSSNVVFLLGFVPPKANRSWTAQEKETWQNKRDFFSCKAKNKNVMDYLTRPGAADSSTTAENKMVGLALDEGGTSIIKYMNERPGSTGVFSKDGITKEQAVIELDATGGNIWHGVISCKDKGSEIDIGSKEHAERLMTKAFDGFFSDSKNHLNADNVNWTCVYHNNTQHSHIHFVFWEKEKQSLNKFGDKCYTYRGALDRNLVDTFRMDFEKQLINENFLGIGACRKEMLDLTKSMLGSNKVFSALELKINALSHKLPSKGRLSYNSENCHYIKKDVDAIVRTVLQSRQIRESFNELTTILSKRTAALNKIKGTELTDYGITVINDIYARVGNQIIKRAQVYKAISERQSRGSTIFKGKKLKLNRKYDFYDFSSEVLKDHIYRLRQEENKIKHEEQAR